MTDNQSTPESSDASPPAESPPFPAPTPQDADAAASAAPDGAAAPTGGVDGKPAKAVPPQQAAAKAAAPARELPAPEEIASWIEGRDLPSLAALFHPLPLARFDVLVMQIKKEELLPQHWQPFADHSLPPGLEFEDLGEVRRLRRTYDSQEIAGRRLGALEKAWRELAGKQPALWSVSDLFAGIRRLIDHGTAVDFHDLLSAARDVWAGMTLPHGREQLEVLWACLVFIRAKTKK